MSKQTVGIRKGSRPSSSTQISAGLIAFLFVVAQLLPTQASAGSAPAVLDCKSASRTGGVVTITGLLPGDYEVLDLKIKKGNAEQLIKGLNTLDRDMDPAEVTKLEEEGVIAKDRVLTIVENFERGVFTVALRGSDVYELRLYALPQTVRARITPNSKKASFEAMLLEANIPGDSRNYPDRRAIRMRCTYDHTI